MPQLIAKFDPSAKTTDTFGLRGLSNGIGTLLLFNDSAWNLDLTFPDGSTDIAPAWLASIYLVTGPAGNVTWTQDVQSNTTVPDLSRVWAVVYRPNEKVPGVFPAALTRQTKSGGGSTAVSNASQLISSGLASGAVTIIKSTLQGQTILSVQMTNDGTFTIIDVLHSAAQLFQVITGQTAGLPSVIAGDAANPLAAPGGIQLIAGSFSYVAVQSGTINGNTSTYTHNLGWVPDIVLVSDAQSNQANSISLYSYTSTQVSTFNSSANPQSVKLLFIKL